MKTIVITGSTRGIGFGLADSFLALECNVCVSGRTNENVIKAVERLTQHHHRQQVFGVACDISEYMQVQELWNAAKAHFGAIDIWVNNAGIANSLTSFWDLPQELTQTVIETNILGTMYASQVAVRGMLQQGHGALYNMEGYGSTGGRMVKGLALYGTTKAALHYLNHALAEETRSTPVLVGALAPGMVVTDMITSQYEGRQAEFEKVKPIFNILCDRVETVTPWLARRMLANQKNGVRISWSNPWRLMGRFMTAPFKKRDLFS